ncbi:hypothetical protein LTS18_004779 [Coniosporium uncinatum]|uniref:Uncharacterized protein n=1 Tax=Coniosporium uncinatum TaxID=93489 RepID=A0ACC3DBD1_9PEZI|nr:hypothetical protein LTS18_004779 [Coniosporium uncinatum]
MVVRPSYLHASATTLLLGQSFAVALSPPLITPRAELVERNNDALRFIGYYTTDGGGTDQCVDSLTWTVSATFGDCVSSGSATSTPYDFTTKCGGGSDSKTAFFGSTSAVCDVLCNTDFIYETLGDTTPTMWIGCVSPSRAQEAYYRTSPNANGQAQLPPTSSTTSSSSSPSLSPPTSQTSSSASTTPSSSTPSSSSSSNAWIAGPVIGIIALLAISGLVYWILRMKKRQKLQAQHVQHQQQQQQQGSYTSASAPYTTPAHFDQGYQYQPVQDRGEMVGSPNMAEQQSPLVAELYGGSKEPVEIGQGK